MTDWTHEQATQIADLQAELEKAKLRRQIAEVGGGDAATLSQLLDRFQNLLDAQGAEADTRRRGYEEMSDQIAMALGIAQADRQRSEAFFRVMESSAPYRRALRRANRAAQRAERARLASEAAPASDQPPRRHGWIRWILRRTRDRNTTPPE